MLILTLNSFIEKAALLEGSEEWHEFQEEMWERIQEQMKLCGQECLSLKLCVAPVRKGV